MAEKDLSAPVISLMLAVRDAPTAVAWYKRALGARQLWSLGAVAGLEIAGAAFFVGQPEGNGWESPENLGKEGVFATPCSPTRKPKRSAGASRPACAGRC